MQTLSQLEPQIQVAPRPVISFFELSGVESQPAARDADSMLRRYLATGDVIGAVAAFAIAFVATGNPVDPWTLLAAIAVVPVNKLLGLYDRDAHVLSKTTIDEFPKLLNSAVVLAFFAAAANDLAHPGSGSFSARFLVVFVAATALSLGLFRVAARRTARSRVVAERCLVIGGPGECEELRRKLSLSPTVNATVVGRAPLSACSSGGREIRESISRRNVDRLIVVPDEHHPDDVSEAIRAMRSFGVKISVMPRLLEAIGSSVERDEVCGAELIGIKDMRMTRSSQLIKRGLDVAAAAGGLLLLSPFLAVAACAIKLDSPGAVFYRQRRIGRDGDAFAMVKFRTMVDGADKQQEALREHNESDGFFKIADDPRVTRVGKLLRKTSLDELPQLLNVLRGDMSLVGPRPLVPDEDENITGWYRRRSQITPGMTGVWQLHGPVRIPMQEMVKLDYGYVASWSLWSDLKILLKTLPHVIGRRGL